MFWRKKRPTIDTETVDWILECWQWLDEVLGPVDAGPPRQMIRPSRSLFPDTSLKGHQKAEHYFARVQALCGLGDWPVELKAQAPAPDLGQSVVFAAQQSRKALGTFRTKGNAAVITYDPGQLNDPIQLIATFAHELAHYVLLNARDDPPGGPELEELATDLATVHLGFGLFGANAAFSFKQSTDFDRQGWSSSRSGYLGEGGWCFACALFAEILEIEPETYRAYTKDSVAAQIRKDRLYLASKPEIVRNCRSEVGVPA